VKLFKLKTTKTFGASGIFLYRKVHCPLSRLRAVVLEVASVGDQGQGDRLEPEALTPFSVAAS
jgi:hypothetical protein